MDAVTLRGLFFLVLLCVASCGGDSQPSPPTVSEQEQLSRSYSTTLPQEITSDETVSLTVNSSNDSNSQKVTVEPLSTSLETSLNIVITSEDKFNFIAPQCTPSRAGMVTAVYQQRLGVDDNRYTPIPESGCLFI